MDRKQWVIKTNKGRFVGIPYMVRGGFRSFLNDKPVWNKTRTFNTSEEAEKGLANYLSPTNNHYIDRDTFKEGEKLDGVEEVLVLKEGIK